MRCVGLDLGTTKVAGLLLDTGPPGSPARLLQTVSREHGAGLPPAHPWEHLQDPDRLLAAAQAVLEELCAAGGPADGLCVTGQVHGILYVDAAGRAVSPLFTWLDRRAWQQYPAGGSYAEALSALSGHWVPPGYGAATHFFNRGGGLVPPRAAGLCALPDYVTMHLGRARRPVSDPTVAASLGLYDLEENRFDPRALQAAGLDDLAWSRVVPAGTRVGSTRDGTAVFAPLGDNQAGFLGAVREVERCALLNVGTGGQISVFTVRAGRLPPPLETRPFPGGGFLQVGAALCSGKAYALLEELFRQVCSQLGGSSPPGSLFERMNELAARQEEDGEPPLEVDTRFQGTRAEAAVTGSIQGITLGNLTTSALVRGFLRGIAGELHGYYRQIAQACPGRITALVASGNGIRRNAALRAEVARRFGLPVLVPRGVEEAALGAALCAAVGLGALPGYERAGELIEYGG